VNCPTNFKGFAIVISPIILVLIVLAVVSAVIFVTGLSVNGKPMRFDPSSHEPAKSWYIEGNANPDGEPVPLSCSFVEFDERGDFLDFAQHVACAEKLKKLAQEGQVLLVIYCHGWKNSSQSYDVVSFNSFLARLAASQEIRDLKLRVHGVYLGWRGNAFRPYVSKGVKGENYEKTIAMFGKPIIDDRYHRKFSWSLFIPENLSYWNRKMAAEQRVAGLPLARAIFTYAGSVKRYGENPDNRVIVIGHSFGALLLERSLGQAMTGAITMDWSQEKGAPPVFGRRLPFEMILFVNSAAPAIYAKLLRDFLEANRAALTRYNDPWANVPLVVSITSTADSATGKAHPLGNLLAPFAPSLQRSYTTGIFVNPPPPVPPPHIQYPSHPKVRQSKFYTTTPGHNRYLINHWIVSDPNTAGCPEEVFTRNLSTKVANPKVFQTVNSDGQVLGWRITDQPPQGQSVTLGSMVPAMQHSDYWIISCGKELIRDHNDIWSPITMELYAGIFRAVQSCRDAAS
jgi:hypothetical protein